MLPNKVAPVSLYWFKSVSGYANTVSAACNPPARTHVLDEGLGLDLAAPFFLYLVNICLHVALDCSVWPRNRGRGREKKDQRTNVWNISIQPRHDAETGNAVIHFCVQSNLFFAKIRQIRRGSTPGEFNGYCVSMWNRFFGPSNKLGLNSQKEDCGFKTFPRFKPFRVILCFFVIPGFAELQTDMTDLTKELNRSQGIPFLEYKQFVTRTFFPKVRKTIVPYRFFSSFPILHYPLLVKFGVKKKKSPRNFKPKSSCKV